MLTLSLHEQSRLNIELICGAYFYFYVLVYAMEYLDQKKNLFWQYISNEVKKKVDKLVYELVFLYFLGVSQKIIDMLIVLSISVVLYSSKKFQWYCYLQIIIAKAKQNY